jgi:hypothetical protein
MSKERNEKPRPRASLNRNRGLGEKSVEGTHEAERNNTTMAHLLLADVVLCSLLQVEGSVLPNTSARTHNEAALNTRPPAVSLLTTTTTTFVSHINES